MILGNVRTPSLVIRDGATLKGTVDMDATQPKSRPGAKKSEVVAPNDDKVSPARGERQDREKVVTA